MLLILPILIYQRSERLSSALKARCEKPIPSFVTAIALIESYNHLMVLIARALRVQFVADE